MGTPSIYGSFSFVTELDCAWATMDIRIFYTNHLFFVNQDSTQDEIASRNKALLFSIIF